jgi:hypothetical protein
MIAGSIRIILIGSRDTWSSKKRYPRGIVQQVQPSGIILEICCRCCLIAANYNLRIEGSRCGLDKEIALDG